MIYILQPHLKAWAPGLSIEYPACGPTGFKPIWEGRFFMKKPPATAITRVNPPKRNQQILHPSELKIEMIQGTIGPVKISPRDDPVTTTPAASPLLRGVNHATKRPMTGTLLAPLPIPVNVLQKVAVKKVSEIPVNIIVIPTINIPVVITDLGPKREARAPPNTESAR
jgi:hypothetical protein